MRRLRALAGYDFGAARHQHQADLIEPDIAAALGCGLRQLAQHHQLGNGGRPPECHERGSAPVVSATSGVELDGQALVAADVVVVRADIFVAGAADQEGAGDQLEGAPRAR